MRIPGFIRSNAERFSRRILLRRRFPTPKGSRTLWVTPEASLKYWLPIRRDFDAPLFDFCDRFIAPGASVWDIGTNVGLFSFYAAALVGRSGSVLSLEADPWIASILHRSLESTPPDHAVPAVLCAAVSNKHATADFVIPERSRASNHLATSPGCSQAGAERSRFHVLTITLDWLLEHFPAPSVVKIDIEGMEAIALQGAQKLLTDVRPILNFEVWESIADELSGMLLAQNYLLFDSENVAALRPVTRATWSTVAIPAEKWPALK